MIVEKTRNRQKFKFLDSIIEVRNDTLFLNGLEVFNVTNLENMVVQNEDATLMTFNTVTHNGEIVLNS